MNKVEKLKNRTLVLSLIESHGSDHFVGDLQVKRF